MNDQNTFKKLTEEIKAELVERLRSPEFQNFIEQTKAATDSGGFEVVISTADIDRQGESIDQNGWDLTPYKSNPVVLWGHDYWSLPIGIADEISVQDGRLTAKGRFAPAEANPFAQQVRRLYDLKIVRATSVGFIVKETQGKTITKAELLEFSFVPVPANPFALSLSKARELNLDLAMLATKGLALEVKAEGDPCTLEDGTEGVMKPDAEGNLICVPKTEEKPEETENYIRIPVKDESDYDPDSVRTISLSEEQGIKALTACPKGEYEDGKCGVGVEIITYLFDKDKWTEEEARQWIKDHEKSGKPKAVTTEQLKPAIESLKQATAALEKLLEGGEGEERRDGDAPNQRSQDAEAQTVIKQLDEFLMARQLLRSIATAASNALEDMNRKVRERGAKRK